MRKILFVVSCDISSTSGGGMVNRALWNALKQLFPDQVDVLHPDTERIVCEKKFFYIPYLSMWGKFTHLLQGKIHRYNPWVLNFVDQHPSEYSHCLVNCGLFGDLVEGLQKRGIKVCTIHHNFETKYQMENKRPCTFGGLTDRFVRKNESKAYLQSDMNLFLTQYDAEQMNLTYGYSKGNDYVIGLFEAFDVKQLPNNKTLLAPNHLVISGGLSSVQSVEGVQQFIRDVVPSIEQTYQGDYDLLLAGRHPKQSIMDLVRNNPKIKVVANPVDMLTTIQEGGIYICPVSTGSGIKTRILDGLKLGMPILTHRVSAQGYDALWNRPWFQIYDDEDSFRKGLGEIETTIKTNPALRQEIMDEYQKLFSFEKGKERYLAAMKRFLNE